MYWAQGHQTLNSSFQSELNTALSTLGPSKRDLTDADIQAIEDHVANAVTNAIENALSPGEKFLTVLGIEHQDHRVGTAIYRFSADELMTSAPEGISSLNGYPKPTQITIIFTSPFQFMAWGFHGTIIADPLPISLRRVLVGLGYQQPLPGLREAMGTFQNSSVSAWVAAVR